MYILKKKEKEIKYNDLPLSCPNNEIKDWKSHPKVFLNIKKNKNVTCPYCGQVYTLKI